MPSVPDLPVEYIGNFAAGEIPVPLLHTFKDSEGAVIDISGLSVTISITSRPVAGSLGTGAMVITDAPNGVVEYTWTINDMASAGDYRLNIWVFDGAPTQRYASDLFTYSVYTGVGP